MQRLGETSWKPRVNSQFQKYKMSVHHNKHKAISHKVLADQHDSALFCLHVFAINAYEGFWLQDRDRKDRGVLHWAVWGVVVRPVFMTWAEANYPRRVGVSSPFPSFSKLSSKLWFYNTSHTVIHIHIYIYIYIHIYIDIYIWIYIFFVIFFCCKPKAALLWSSVQIPLLFENIC